jgi:hypothetical protein
MAAGARIPAAVVEFIALVRHWEPMNYLQVDRMSFMLRMFGCQLRGGTL